MIFQKINWHFKTSNTVNVSWKRTNFSIKQRQLRSFSSCLVKVSSICPSGTFLSYAPVINPFVWLKSWSPVGLLVCITLSSVKWQGSPVAGEYNSQPAESCSVCAIIYQGVYKFNWTNFQEISRRFQEWFQEKSRTCLHCFELLRNVPNLLVCLNIEQKHDMHNMGPWQR